MKRIAALAAVALLLAFATPTAAASPPTATVTIESSCSGWSVAVDYADFAYGDLFVASLWLPVGPGSAAGSLGFWNGGTWVGSGHEREVVGRGPISDVKVMVDINPFGPIDPSLWTVPPGNIVGDGLRDDHPTVTEATLDTSECAPAESSFTMLALSTSAMPPTHPIGGVVAPSSTPPPTSTVPAPASEAPAFPLALLIGACTALLIARRMAGRTRR